MDAPKAITIFGIWLCCGIAPLCGANQEPEAEPLFLRAYHVPLGMFTSPDPNSKEGERRNFNFKEWLTSHGLPFPPGSDVIYQTERGSFPCLVARNTKENLDVLDTILLPTCLGFPTQIGIEFSVYRLNTASAKALISREPSDGWLSKQHTSLLEQIQCTGKNGQKAESHLSTNQIQCDIILEPTLGADQRTIDLNLEYKVQIPAFKKSVEISAKTSLAIEDGHSVLVKSVTLPEQPGSFKGQQNLLIVAKACVVNTCGWSLEILDKEHH